MPGLPAYAQAAQAATGQLHAAAMAGAYGGLTAEEQQMVALVNAERARYGLAPLQVDTSLVQVARLKAQDLALGGYFGHNSPRYGSPFAMMRSMGVPFHTAGENLAGNQSVDRAHAALMASPGHRANILNPNYTRIGVGAYRGGPYGAIYVQEFAG
jgi:uncharacterized YkwD family protein